MDERKSKQRGSESGKEAAQVVEWTAQKRSGAQAKDKGESEEASAGIESDGRQKEIADETIVEQWEKPQGRNHRLMKVEI